MAIGCLPVLGPFLCVALAAIAAPDAAAADAAPPAAVAANADQTWTPTWADNPAPDQATTRASGLIRLDACDALLQPPHLFRCRVVRDMEPGDFTRGPCALDAMLTIDGETVAAVHVDLDHLGQLAGGADLVLAPMAPAPAPGHAAGVQGALTIALTDAGRQLNERLEHQVTLLANLADTLHLAKQELEARHEQDPLPWLWWEQGREAALSGDGQVLSGVAADLGHWVQGERPRLQGPYAGWPPPTSADDLIGIGADRSGADGSVAPVRWRRPAGPVRAVALWCDDPVDPPTKSAWPDPPAAPLAAALAAGVAVIEAYPAGDRHWDGMALDRARRLLILATDGGRPLLLVGSGRGAAAAMKLATVAPVTLRAVCLIAPRLGDVVVQDLRSAVPAGVALRSDAGDGGDALPAGAQLAAADTPEFWAAPPPPRNGTWPSLTSRAAGADLRGPAAGNEPWPPAGTPRYFDHGPLAAYARGPFVVVVGTGESVAAAADNEALARSFVVAWAHHAHGYPPVVKDVDFDERAQAWNAANLVLIGNPRSNATIGALSKRMRLPITWDFRTEIVKADGKTWAFLRSEHRPLAIATDLSPRGGDPPHGVLIIDGAPSWPEDPHLSPLPLANLPAFVMGDATVANDPGAPAPAPGIRLRFGDDRTWAELASGAAPDDRMMPTR